LLVLIESSTGVWMDIMDDSPLVLVEVDADVKGREDGPASLTERRRYSRVVFVRSPLLTPWG
jgi:hypothetical protein